MVTKRSFWIRFNIVLFSGYAIFGFLSLFLPHLLNNVYYIFLHLVTLLVNCMVVYGLIKMRDRINYLIVIISPLMIAHLVIFVTVPLGIDFAFMGPSRAFYMVFFKIVMNVCTEGFVYPSFVIFNTGMAVINLINFCYFIRKKTAETFKGQTNAQAT